MTARGPDGRFVVDELSRRSELSLLKTYRLALMNGFTPKQAASLAAWRDGLAADQDWSIKQVQAMEFLRWRFRNGRLDGDVL